MDTIAEILSELTALMSTGLLTRERGNAAKRYIIEHCEQFLPCEGSPITISEAADMAVELSNQRERDAKCA